MPSKSQKRLEFLEAVTEIQRRRRENKLRYYDPFPKQQEFHKAGRIHSDRLFMAANQIGKTVAGGSEWALHLTGRYPDWWEGAVFEKPVRLWCGGVTGESTRDNPQRILIGQPEIREQWGTGFIPKECLVDIAPSRGVPNSLDSVVVRHGGGGDIQGGDSSLLFKSYEKGREKWQGDTIDGCWFDEEPPEAIYSEGRTRSNNGQLGNFCIITFTPLLGMSSLVRTFLSDDRVKELAAA